MKTLNAPGDLNISRVLRLIWQTKGISRIEIAQQLGVDKSTVTKIVASLEDIGIIRAFAQGNAGPMGGRKPIHLEISPTFGIAIGIEISTDGYVATIVDLHGLIKYETTESLCGGTIFESFDSAMKTVLPIAESFNCHILGIGVGLPAIVNTEIGVIVQSIPLMINEKISFVEWAEKKYSMQVYIENDARCGCLGEMLFRQGKGPENALFLLAEIRKITGSVDSIKNLSVGFGFILHGQPYYGSSFSAGEFRSILWQEGNRGQFSAKDSDAEKVGSDTLAESSVFAELASHVAFFVNMMNLDTVFLGGLKKPLTENLSQQIQKEIARKWPYSLPQNAKVLPASLGEKAVAYGAAGHCIMKFFALPNIYQASGSGPSIKETLKGITYLSEDGTQRLPSQ